MAINPMNFSGAGDLSTGVPEFGKIFEHMAQGYQLSQLPEEIRLKQALTMAQANKAQQDALQNQILNSYLSGNNGGDTGKGFFGGGSELANALINHKLFGSSELPSQQSAREYRDFEAKEKFKKQQEQSEGTGSTITTLQNRISGIDTVLPFIEKLSNMDLPSKVGLPGTTTDKEFQSNIKQAAEQYMTAKNLTSGEGALKNTMDIFQRGTFETSSAYQKRMRRLMKDLIKEKAELKKGLHSDSDDFANKMMKQIEKNSPDAFNGSSSSNDPLGIR